jgi:hypothetical protein
LATAFGKARLLLDEVGGMGRYDIPIESGGDFGGGRESEGTAFRCWKGEDCQNVLGEGLAGPAREPDRRFVCEVAGKIF